MWLLGCLGMAAKSSLYSTLPITFQQDYTMNQASQHRHPVKPRTSQHSLHVARPFPDLELLDFQLTY